MAKLHCVRHNQRVIVMDMGTQDNPIPITVHRNGGKRNEICDTNTVVIDGEFFTPTSVIAQDWSFDNDDPTGFTDDHDDNSEFDKFVSEDDSEFDDDPDLERELWFGTPANPIL